MDLGVAGDPNLEGVWKCISSSGVEILTEFRQPLQVQSQLEVPRILVQLGHIQRT